VEQKRKAGQNPPKIVAPTEEEEESLPGVQWGCIGSLDELTRAGCVLKVLSDQSRPWESLGRLCSKSLSDQSRPWESLGRLCSKSLSDQSRPRESLGRIYEEGLEVGWLTSIGYGGEVLVTGSRVNFGTLSGGQG